MENYKFKYVFDEKRLLNDMAKCQHFHWPLHFNNMDYSGTWSSFSLRSISGKEDDILATPNAHFKDTESLKNCHYFQEIIDFFTKPNNG